VISLLLGILLPSFSGIKARARLTVCAGRMRGVGVGLIQFAAARRNRLPPFAFSDFDCDLPLSGHWGGPSQAADPALFGRPALAGADLNCWRLVAENIIEPRELICPSAGRGLTGGKASYFPHTRKFSTYCLRMPYSEDLFRMAPDLLNWQGQGLLFVYAMRAGGQAAPGADPDSIHWHQRVPLVRLDWTYHETDPASGEQRVVDLANGPMLADAFWYQQHSHCVDSVPGLQAYEVCAGWCHGEWFNVLFGDGSVHGVRDDGTVAANSVAPGTQPAADANHHAAEAVKVWRYFEDNR